MAIAPWRATCIQTVSKLAVRGANRSAAWSIIEANIGNALGLITQAVETDTPAKLVVMPEFALQGPPHGMPVAGWIDLACCTIPGPITEPFQEFAQQRGIYIAGHQFDCDPEWPGRYFNTCFLIGPSGDVILRYRRINTAAFPSPHDFMDAYLERHSMAEVFPVADTELGRIAMIPCGEINVPEVARVYMMQGAEVILHPTNSPRRPAQEAAKVVRAAENMVYLVSANVAGRIGFSFDGINSRRPLAHHRLSRSHARLRGRQRTDRQSLGADRSGGAAGGAEEGHRNRQPAVACALGDVSAVFRQRIVLSAEPVSRYANGRRRLCQACSCGFTEEHGQGRRHRRAITDTAKDLAEKHQ